MIVKPFSVGFYFFAKINTQKLEAQELFAQIATGVSDQF